MKKIGVIGIGMLGNAVASHLVNSGFSVTAYNRTKEKTFQLKEKGVKIASSPKEVAENSELVIIIVRDADAVKKISFEKDGIVEGNHDKLIVADMSTIDPTESKNISKMFQEYNINKLDIPVMGGPNVAITGNLVMMVSGNKKSFDDCKNIFEIIASKVFFLGESGVAHTIKLAMNLQITMLALALSEGITLVKKANVDPKIFLEILNTTYFKTGMSENKAFRMIDGKYEVTFTLANLKKDINTMTYAAKSLGVELPMIKKAEEIYENAVKAGFGNMDYTSIAEYIKKINE
ncbi:NAD binding domain of 6-phosphogluconate dehydrogenase [Candidatus Nitrosopumilus salaria BD31]|uniref:NAD binding domain of 6-phosphogluconate dehydrogenase n=1 Tax=Candidatus Nitrosopumilus salarius BD31 TaxID=859350 RepID=I3D335_9ARCH|nr:NAD(P)-dependent oxidoreductase [Candidatus Nitrosopumilus salaria]EIJ66128.1 NAD binding domain of 6-phosphogluconate dehydrogenase [Candidatus Nitrosopumilus salaria BD31]